MSKGKNAEAMELLEDIHEKVTGNGPEVPSTENGGPRWQPRPDQQPGRVLEILYENGQMTVSEISEGMDNMPAITRSMTDLYRAYLVERDEKPNNVPNKYEINQNGEWVVESWTKQAEIGELNPWEQTELNRSQYIALELVAEYDGRPRSSEVNEDYLERTDANAHENGVAVGARLTELYDMGHLGRPDYEPYIYWATESGRGILE